MDKYRELAAEIIDDVIQRLEKAHWQIEALAMEVADDENKSLLYGEDYYAAEDNAATLLELRLAPPYRVTVVINLDEHNPLDVVERVYAATTTLENIDKMFAVLAKEFSVEEDVITDKFDLISMELRDLSEGSEGKPLK